MNAFVVSFLVIAPAEMADKTQLLALFLASRFKRPVPVIGGMFCAILASHLVAGGVGQWLGGLLKGNTLHLLLGLSLLAAAVWAFIPDGMDEKPAGLDSNHSIFITTFLSFIVAEIGDKTQLATVALAAQFHALLPVVLGTTLGMMAVNVPAVLLSHVITGRVSLKWIRALSGALFAALGLYELGKIGY